MPEPSYRRLTRKHRSLAGYAQLWLAPDHLLLVNSHRFNENYQRFLLTDIQAISVTDGPDVFIFQVLAGLAAIGWELLAFWVNAIFAKWFFGITGVLFLGLAVIDVARGPRCRCLLYTAVSQQRLRAVSRKSTAQRFLAILAPAIEAVQGPLATAVPQDAVSGAAEVPLPPPQPTRRFGAAQVLFALYLFDALIVQIIFLLPRANASIIFPMAILGELMLAVVALAQGSARPLRLGNVLITLGAIAGGYDLLTLGRLFWAAALRGVFEGPAPPDFNAILAPSLPGVVFASIWRVALGALGLILFVLSRERKPSA